MTVGGGVVLVRGGVDRRASLRRTEPGENPDKPGKTATAPGKAPGVFFFFEGGIREAGNTDGTGSISMARYTRCIA